MMLFLIFFASFVAGHESVTLDESSIEACMKQSGQKCNQIEAIKVKDSIMKLRNISEKSRAGKLCDVRINHLNCQFKAMEDGLSKCKGVSVEDVKSSIDHLWIKAEIQNNARLNQRCQQALENIHGAD